MKIFSSSSTGVQNIKMCYSITLMIAIHVTKNGKHWEKILCNITGTLIVTYAIYVYYVSFVNNFDIGYVNYFPCNSRFNKVWLNW